MLVLIVVGAMVLAVLPASAAPKADRNRSYAIEVLSSPADLVSGGDARLSVRVPPGNLDRARIRLNGEDVTDDFQVVPGTSTLEGVVDGLVVGENLVQVLPNSRARGAASSLTLTNYPISGPMFSGPQQEPFLCSDDGDRANAELGPAIDENCATETVVSFKYMKTGGGWGDYDPVSPPSDVATTTTMDGETVDYIVRWERGTINRFIYSIAVLSPEGQDAEPDLSAWNGKLIYYFQGGVAIGHYQGDPSGSRMLYDYGLGKGYAVVYSTGTKTGTHYNLELGGETAIMVKDRFVSAYANPVYTVGVGGSGGGIQQYVYAQNHPGLIDAAIPQYSYPDMVTQTIHVGDCELLERWIDFELFSGDVTWADWEHRSWLEGLNASNSVSNGFISVMPPGYPAGSSECIEGWRGLSPLALNPHFGTAPGISPSDQASTEWTHFADLINIYGYAADDYAASTWDNVGVQYGLQALVDGNITPGQFLDLNANAGSWKNEPEMVQEGCPFIGALCSLVDPTVSPPFPGVWPDQIDVWSARNMALSPDGGLTPAPRKEADPGAIASAFSSGMVNVGAIEIPMIDWRNYLERELNMHNSHQSFASRQRLLNHDGDASNQVIWFTDDGVFDQTPMAFEVIDEWMANIAADPKRRVAVNKPAAAVDSCFDSSGNLIYAGDDAWSGILDGGAQGTCTAQFPIFSTSRIVAGAPITGDVFKCELQSIESAIASGIYGSWTPNTAEVAQLNAIFPTGVCDY
ncbi:MAG: DUF6351 family protein [Acidimicrobiia bacterium]|nr:DUF6351 family protein [Acidimicrobiia bacterium]